MTTFALVHGAWHGGWCWERLTPELERRGHRVVTVDLNASRNPQGSPPHQDLRLVHVMERHGFSWGGRWPTVPDGMHFEFHGDGATAADEPL